MRVKRTIIQACFENADCVNFAIAKEYEPFRPASGWIEADLVSPQPAAGVHHYLGLGIIAVSKVLYFHRRGEYEVDYP